MRVPDEVRKCVIYLGTPIKSNDGRDVMLPVGTGFFVGVPLSVSGVAHMYVVTARHVADVLRGKAFTIRVNTTSGGALLQPASENMIWWHHPTDPTSDVAAFAWAPGAGIEYTHVPLTMLLVDDVIKSKAIGLGDDVFITGLFIHLGGAMKNQPIVRTGTIAMMPDEPVPSSLGPIEAYLIEARSIGGLSGSPVFVRETVQVGLGPFHLLGLMHGHWDIPPAARDDIAHQDIGDANAKVNMGIAIVVPAKKIREILLQPQLVTQRQEWDDQHRDIPMPASTTS